ncbi:MAG: NYN domain-containing protein [Candidatus Omnitrophota bacterium]|nr:NYN domain-containing protein [Candidatus Omnitrophota bacterium]
MKVLIVDGYNAIHKIPEIDSIMDESLDQARSAITGLAKEYQRRIGGISEVFVVFDGQDEYRGLSLNKPNQVFSRTGQGDRKVIRLAQDKSDKFHVVVVSDDNRVGNSCRAAGATVITVKKFYDAIKKY